MPIGVNTYKGLGVPLYGESEILQESTLDILTLQHSSAQAGNFLVLRDKVSSAGGNFGQGSTDTAFDLFKINADGDIVIASTVLGDGTIKGFKRPVVESTVGQALTIAQSGTLFVVSSAVGTSMTFDLPVGAGVPGTWYEFFVSSVALTGDVRISASSDVAVKIHGYGDGTSEISTFASITMASTGTFHSHFARLTAVTSMLWAFESAGGYSSVTSLSAGMWQVGSTA
ncbi:hypothetical protein LCGC14_0984610 [marine sediment metagenome]|uniref:Uncharacterized protein n=1 Tax=marine sediment metagenome TaxID=412755 RepID=A0A0F9QQW8_9ZZZZ